MSVVLPAPFSPSSAWTSPRAHIEVDVVVGDEVPEALGDAPQPDGGVPPPRRPGEPWIDRPGAVPVMDDRLAGDLARRRSSNRPAATR